MIFTFREGDKLKFIKEHISVSATGIEHKPKNLRLNQGSEQNAGSENIVFNRISSQDVQIMEMIGSGSAGKVYKGIYSHDGQEKLVAVKTVNIYEKPKRKQLLNDLKSLTGI